MSRRRRTSKPRPLLLLPWGSRSTITTWRPSSAIAAPRLMAVVVLPTPPFWLTMATIRVSDVGNNILGSPAG